MEKKNSPGHPGLKPTLIGILASALLALVKALAGIFGHSYALIADAIESTADIFTSGMLWLGLRWAGRPPDKTHPYGHGKAEALISVGIALVLCAAAIVIVVEGIRNIRIPHPAPASWTLLVLIVVIVTKELLYRYVFRKGAEMDSGAVKADAFHHRSDAITSAAAFIGIAIGLLGGKGYEAADDWAALFVSGFILFNACRIARPAIGELLDEELDSSLGRKIKSIAANVEGVANVEKCHTRKMGMTTHADLHIWVAPDLTVTDGHTIAHRVKQAIQEAFPRVADVMIHVEPAK